MPTEQPWETLRRRLHDDGPILVAPGAYDTLGAFVIEQAGHEAVYVTGGGISYSALARPDVGLLSFEQMAERVLEIVERVGALVIVDGDTGYGGVHNVQRTWRRYARFGVAAVQIEDQSLPKRCGHLADKRLVPTDEMVTKIAAVKDLGDGPLVIARTDARAVVSLEEAIERGHRYFEAGADVVFVESPVDDDELRRVVAELGDEGALLANMMEGGITPFHSGEELGAMGFDLVIYPNSMARAVAHTMERIAVALRETGTTRAMFDEMWLFDDLVNRLGMEELTALEHRLTAGPATTR